MAITYVNDLRLSEMGTGDNSGTWGTVTNTNLELIGEALGFGTEAITTNADTHASTIADGSTDPVRAMYVKYTGTLDSACTITIGPNTVNKFYYIENATSGSQNIIISQGSGANVTIPAGDTKAVYLDGAGSGAAVTDAFASLNVVDLKVQDDLSLTSDSAVLNIGADNDLKITHDGTNGDFESAGDLTLDVAGDINLNADGGDIFLADDSVTFGKLKNSSSHFFIQSLVADKDILIIGNDSDGGGEVTAVEFDMSDAGTAKFGHDAKFADNGQAIFGTGSDLKIFHDGSDSRINNTTGKLMLKDDVIEFVRQADDTVSFKVSEGGSTELFHNHNTKLTTEDDGIDVTGYIDYGPSSGNIGKIGSDSNNVYIGATSGTGQIFFKNNISSNDAPHSSGDTKMVITDDGVGINTTAPAAPLQVDSDNGFPTLVLSRDGGVSGRRPFGVAIGGPTDATMFITASNDTTGAGAFGGNRVVLMELEAAGDVIVKTGNLVVGTAGKGIDFSAQTSANSVTGVTTGDELLDHYEEGVWTPVSPTVTFTNNEGRYTRIGREVFISCTITVPSTSSGVSALIDGFPFTSIAGAPHAGFYLRYTNGNTFRMFFMSASANRAEMYNIDGVATTLAQVSTKRFDFSGSYQV